MVEIISNSISEFRHAISATGLIPPEIIEPGRLYRYPGFGKKRGNNAGWCRLFDDMRGGVYGDWSTGLTQTWRANRQENSTPAEQARLRFEVEQVKRQREVELHQQQKSAAIKSCEQWVSARSELGRHSYLLGKNISGNGLRRKGTALIVPMYDSNGDLRNIQKIFPEGEKQFQKGARVKGLFCPIGKPKGDSLLICEGLATGETLYQSTGDAVAVAFTAGNLKWVAIALREKYPDFNITLCADNDRFTDGNPGVTKAREAALAVGGRLAVPEFPHDTKGTDFNDLAKLAEVVL